MSFSYGNSSKYGKMDSNYFGRGVPDDVPAKVNTALFPIISFDVPFKLREEEIRNLLSAPQYDVSAELDVLERIKEARRLEIDFVLHVEERMEMLGINSLMNESFATSTTTDLGVSQAVSHQDGISTSSFPSNSIIRLSSTDILQPAPAEKMIYNSSELQDNISSRKINFSEFESVDDPFESMTLKVLDDRAELASVLQPVVSPAESAVTTYMSSLSLASSQPSCIVSHPNAKHGCHSFSMQTKNSVFNTNFRESASYPVFNSSNSSSQVSVTYSNDVLFSSTPELSLNYGPIGIRSVSNLPVILEGSARIPSPLSSSSNVPVIQPLGNAFMSSSFPVNSVPICTDNSQLSLKRLNHSSKQCPHISAAQSKSIGMSSHIDESLLKNSLSEGHALYTGGSYHTSGLSTNVPNNHPPCAVYPTYSVSSFPDWKARTKD